MKKNLVILSLVTSNSVILNAVMDLMNILHDFNPVKFCERAFTAFRMTELIRIGIFTLFLLAIPCVGFAEYWSNHNEGWHWYNYPAVEEVPTNSANKPVQSKVNPSATDKIEKLQKVTKERLNLALLEPTEQNVINYITLQNALVNKASRFSSMWQRVVWQHPEIDFSINNPVSDVGNQVFQEEKHVKSNAMLGDISKRYGLFFYFSSTCAYCQKMSPTVKSFAEYYSFEVMPITLDGQSLPDFPHARHDNGSTLNLKVEVVPALYLVDKKTKEIIPIGFGLMSLDELEKRMVVLLSKQEETSHAKS